MGSGSPADQGETAGDPTLATSEGSDETLRGWLDRCRELATSDLDGIEDPARELANLAAGDRSLMERAYRVLRPARDREPRNSTLGQMMWFWRRAFEKGSWTWEEDLADPHHYLS